MKTACENPWEFPRKTLIFEGKALEIMEKHGPKGYENIRIPGEGKLPSWSTQHHPPGGMSDGRETQGREATDRTDAAPRNNRPYSRRILPLLLPGDLPAGTQASPSLPGKNRKETPT